MNTYERKSLLRETINVANDLEKTTGPLTDVQVKHLFLGIMWTMIGLLEESNDTNS